MSGHRNVSQEEVQGWFSGRLPDGWYTGAPEVSVDREEILVVGTLPDPEVAKDATPEVVASAREARIDGFREDTREQRMRIADEAQQRFGRSARSSIRWSTRASLAAGATRSPGACGSSERTRPNGSRTSGTRWWRWRRLARRAPSPPDRRYSESPIR
jgi:hypothetical protein